jgi:hypothetical protein
VAREQILQRAIALIPPEASLSASAALAPHVSQRSKLYVFPAVLDADFVLLDITASPAPTSAGDVFLHVRTLLREGNWRVALAESGVLLLQRVPVGPPLSPDSLPSAFYAFGRETSGPSAPLAPIGWSFLDGTLGLEAGAVLPSPDGAVEPDGPQGTLRTVWRLNGPLPEPARVVFYLTMDDGVEVPAGDGAAALWWYPVERWQPGETVQVDLPSISLRRVTAWRAAVEPRPPG